MMRRASVALLLFASLTFARQGPRGLVGTPEVFRFGTVDMGTVVEGVFVLENRGERPLRITGFSLGCSCARGSFDRKALAVGDKAELSFEFDTRQLEGALRRGVSVRWIDAEGARGAVSLGIEGRIRPAWRVVPATIDLGDLDPGEKVVRDLVVEFREAPGPRVWTARPEQEIRQGEGPLERRIRVEFEAPDRTGPFQAGVAVFADDPAKPSQLVPVFGKVRGDLVAQPEHLAFGLVDAAKGAERRLILESASGRSFKIAAIEGGAAFEIEGSEAPASPRHELVVRIPPEGTVANGRGELVFRTDDPKRPSLRVSWSARIVKR